MSLLIEIQIDEAEPRRVNHESIAKALNTIARGIFATEALGRPTCATVISTDLGSADLSIRYLIGAERADEPPVFEDS